LLVVSKTRFFVILPIVMSSAPPPCPPTADVVPGAATGRVKVAPQPGQSMTPAAADGRYFIGAEQVEQTHHANPAGI
jgi:hypothetical protein